MRLRPEQDGRLQMQKAEMQHFIQLFQGPDSKHLTKQLLLHEPFLLSLERSGRSTLLRTYWKMSQTSGSVSILQALATTRHCFVDKWLQSPSLLCLYLYVWKLYAFFFFFSSFFCSRRHQLTFSCTLCSD